MRGKLPKIKRNKKQSEDAGFAGFDLTGGSAPAKQPDDTFGLMASDEDAFEVSVRNADPILKRLDAETKGKIWIRDLQINLAASAMLMAMFSLLLSSAYIPEMIPFALPVIPVFIVLTTLESLDRSRIRLIVSAVIAVALIALLIIFRKYIGSGWALITDHLYDSAEEAQAYIYNRFHVGSTGEEHPYRSMHFALLWGSSAIGLMAAQLPVKARRLLAAALGVVTMIAFAYYGIIPSSICIAIMIAALVFALARGHIMSSIPVLLLVMIIFGAIMLADPGENYGISRADENFRDRFALRSSFLEKTEDSLDDLSSIEDGMQNEQDQNEGSAGSGFIAEHRMLMTLIIILAILAAAGAAGWMFRQRLHKKQLANRAGIDSSDPREAIVAMFPYAVRWLQPAGIDTSGKSFDSLIPMIRADVSEEYADSYKGMYELWKEAAYSDHEMREESRNEMNMFLQETISMIRGKGNFRNNLINTIKYAL